jgi:eukaryotic-like serine/threonine-protein kinase
MIPERWRHVSQIYHDALGRDPHARAAFVREACAGDDGLRQDVESLLAQPASAENFLGEPATRLMPDRGVSVLTGQRIGGYEILGLLGAGGMGEVYRARDTRLGRDVAVKVLPRVFSADLERLARFEREARLLAALNHPHIGAIYGVEEADGIHALILELVEGPTLADRLRRGPLPIADVLPIARQIVGALEAAHDRGIVHRDLKPANIKLKVRGAPPPRTENGRLERRLSAADIAECDVKVLDFGLAKAAVGDVESPDRSQAPTRSQGGTVEGLVLGTASYMSPEQARGHAVDARTDIWAFGCVLYEMVTGQAAFPGGTLADTLAAILEREPDLAKLPATTPPGIRHLLPWCLAKDPKRRLRDIGDALPDLDAVSTRVSAPARAGSSVGPGNLLWGLLLGAIATAVAVAVWVGRPASAPDIPSFSRALRLTTTPAHEFGPAISPDGKWVAYLSDARGTADVWVRFVAGGEPANLTASTPLEIQARSAIGGLDISPDGTSIAVQARPKDGTRATFDTWLIPAPLGGTPRRLVETAGALRWSPDGTRIVYVRPGETRGDAIVVADANGGNAREVVAARGGWHTHWPAWSADGRFIYFSQTLATWNGEPSEILRVAAGGGNVEAIVRTTRRALFPLPARTAGCITQPTPPASISISGGDLRATGGPAVSRPESASTPSPGCHRTARRS